MGRPPTWGYAWGATGRIQLEAMIRTESIITLPDVADLVETIRRTGSIPNIPTDDVMEPTPGSYDAGRHIRTYEDDDYAD